MTLWWGQLPGTIFSVAEEIKRAGGRALPIACDIRDDAQVQRAVEQTVAEYFQVACPWPD